MKIDNGSTALKSPCGAGNVEVQYMLYYLFDGILAGNTQPIALLA